MGLNVWVHPKKLLGSVLLQKSCLWHCLWRLVVYFCFIFGVSGVGSSFDFHQFCCMSKWRVEGLGRPVYLSINAYAFMCRMFE